MRKLILSIIFSLSMALPDPNQLLIQMNIARTAPQTFANTIQVKYSSLPGAAEAVAYLNSAPTLTPYNYRGGLNAVAQVQANYLKGLYYVINPHQGCNGNTVGTRLSQIGSWSGVGENIMTNVENEEEIVVRWIIDSGNVNLQNRMNVMDDTFDSVGFGVSNGVFVNDIVVANFAENFVCNPCPYPVQEDTVYDCSYDPYSYSGSPPKLVLSVGLILSFLIVILMS